ncbi:MAG: NERD domain-containing protein [Bacteroidota bacterium]
MIHRLYNPWQITNDGEREADRQLMMRGNMEDMPIHVLHSLRISSRYHRVQMSGECDFVILSKLGIMVVEVKGGIMGYGSTDHNDYGFYRLAGDDQREMVRNPFNQADENAHAIQSFLREKGLINIFVGSVVCFPECVFDCEGVEFKYLWHRGCDKEWLRMIMDSMQEQIAEFYEKQDERNVAMRITWETLDEERIAAITEMLKPEFDPSRSLSQSRLNLGESERRLEEGLHILHGLSENQRIMVQGPPGSGKSTYAFDLIVGLCRSKEKKGLYLCWNEFLAARMENKLRNALQENPSDTTIRISAYYHFLEELVNLLGDTSLMPTYDSVSKGEFSHLIHECLGRLHKAKKLPRYDFIVADEAQDLFDKGLDQVIKSLLKANNPLQKGNYYLFFDDNQAFPKFADLDTYIRTREALKDASAYYIQFANLRVNTGHGITELIQDAGHGQADPLKNYGNDVKFIAWKRPEEVIGILRQYINQETTLSQSKPENMVVLFTADLLKTGSALKEHIREEPEIELLTVENLDKPSEKVRYTTALRSKGLEWDTVFLVCSSMTDPKNLFQLFIGASRAKGKVFVISH